MTDSLLQMGLSNACFSLALAILAMVVGATTKRPHLAYMLWLLVFVKLVTPPIVTIPVVTIPGQPSAAVAMNSHSRSGLPVADNREPGVAEQPNASLSARIGSVVFSYGNEWLPPVWLLGSVVVFAWSLVRVDRFGRLLAAESEVAPQQLQTASVRIARRLELKTIPTICTTSARISPMVWWAGGKVRIVIPAALLDQTDEKQWRWILAHELAHVRRRDYLVRWLEWLACVAFWWNPVVWWAQRNLRAAEETCCDALVLSCLKPNPPSYANSLLTAVEFLACPAYRPPAMASEINSGGFLERRFRMIVSENSSRVDSRWLRACVLLCAIVVLPFGLAYAQDYEAVGKRLRAAVEAGELNGEQARAMLGTLRKAGGAKKDQDSDRAKDYLAKVKKERGAAIEAGKISEEEAVKKYEGAEKAIKERMATGRGDRGSNRISREDYARAEVELRKALAEGKISGEDARARLRGMRKMMGEQSDRGSKRIIREDLGRAGIRIRKAVAEGKISKDEGRAKMAAMRRMMAEQGDIDVVALRKRLGAAVDAGRITKEEARAKFAEIKKATDAKDKKGIDYKAIGERIKAAVKAGKLTEEEARAKWKAIKKADDD